MPDCPLVAIAVQLPPPLVLLLEDELELLELEEFEELLDELLLDEDELLEEELLLDEPPPPLTENEKELLVRPAPPCQSSKPASISIRYQLRLKRPRDAASLIKGIKSIFAELTGESLR